MLLAACGTHNAVTSQQQSTISQGTATTQQGTTTTPASKTVTAKLDITVNDGSKDFNVDGKLQMRWGKVVRVLITPFGLMEAGRLEFTPDYVLLMDRMNKQYVKEKYSDVEFLKKNKLDFNEVQRRFWDEYKKSFVSLTFDKMSLNITVKKPTTDGDFEDQTTVADKYSKVSIQDVISKLTNM